MKSVPARKSELHNQRHGSGLGSEYLELRARHADLEAAHEALVDEHDKIVADRQHQAAHHATDMMRSYGRVLVLHHWRQRQRDQRVPWRRRIRSWLLSEASADLLLEPIRGVVPTDDTGTRWQAIDDDPQFLITSLEQYAGRWLQITIQLQPDQPLQIGPLIYLDTGAGYSEDNVLELPKPDRITGHIRFSLLVPPQLLSARFDPMARTGAFTLDGPLLRNLSMPKALWRMLSGLRGTGEAGRFVSELVRQPSQLLDRESRHRLLEPLVSAHWKPRVHQTASYSEWIGVFEIDRKRYPELVVQQAAWARQPLISVLMPTYNTPRQVLRAAIESVRAQVYPHWELCIADDASTDVRVRAILQEYAASDARIKVVFRGQNGHISAATNSALDIATGEFVALLDHDDALHPLALHYVAQTIVTQPEARLIYTDEDKLNSAGIRCDPYFKCDFNYELFLAQNMICHLGCYQREVLLALGGFRIGLEGSQDWDVALRFSENIEPSQIVHIPRVLYHWRQLSGSAATSTESKPYARIAALRAVTEHLDRIGIEGVASEAPEHACHNRVQFSVPTPQPSVTIIVPTRDRLPLLKTCIDSILERSTYQAYQILIIDNGSCEPETLAYFDALPRDRVRVFEDQSPFNYSALNNRAVLQTGSDLICLMNNDIEIITPDWLEEMVSMAARPGTGAVGARLWFPDGRLQHGGVILGIGGVAGHAHKHAARESKGYAARAVLHQEMSAVTAACLLVRRSIWDEVGGLDENLKVAFNDIDFCLKIRSKSYRNIWTPYAEMIHHESASRGYETTPEGKQRFMEEVLLMKARWGSLLSNDPAYSPNLTLETENFALSWSPRVAG